MKSDRLNKDDWFFSRNQLLPESPSESIINEKLNCLISQSNIKPMDQFKKDWIQGYKIGIGGEGTIYKVNTTSRQDISGIQYAAKYISMDKCKSKEKRKK
eukprot:212946_1